MDARAGGRGRRRERATVSKWLRSYRAQGERVSSTAPRRRARSRRTPRCECRRRLPAPAADDGGGDRRVPADAALDRVRVLSRSGAGQALAWSRQAYKPLRAPPCRRARASTSKVASAAPTRHRQPCQPTQADDQRQARRRHRLGVRARLRRRRHPARLRGGARGQGARRGRLPAPTVARFRATGSASTR